MYVLQMDKIRSSGVRLAWWQPRSSSMGPTASVGDVMDCDCSQSCHWELWGLKGGEAPRLSQHIVVDGPTRLHMSMVSGG